MKFFIYTALLLSSALLDSQMAYADSMRCENLLASSGDTLNEVRAKCGEPDDAIHRTETKIISDEVSVPCDEMPKHTKCSRTVSTSVETVIDEWTYDFGSNRFIQILRFEDGRLVRITDGRYGKKKI